MMSESLQSALKTSLSMLLALYLALSLGWDKPIWAVMTVFIVSLGSVGASLQKGMQRVAGTFVGAGLAVLLSAGFAQQMWPFVLSLALTLYVLSYLGSVSRSPYAFQMCSLVLLLIVTSAGMSESLTFILIIARVQETLLGVVCFTLVDVFVWPKHQRNTFDGALKQYMVALRTTLHSNYTAAAKGQALRALPSSASARSLMPPLNHLELLQRAASFELSSRVIAAATWQNFVAHSHALFASLSQFRWHFDLLHTADRHQLQLVERWQRIEALLGPLTGPSQQMHMAASVQGAAVAPASAKHSAALGLLNHDLAQMEQHLSGLVASHAALRAGEREALKTPALQPHYGYLQLSKLSAALLVPITLLLSFTIWRYTLVPTGTLFIFLATTLAIVQAINPRMPLRKAVMPVLVGLIIAFAQYTLVLPWFSEFYQLAALLFVNVFTLLWWFSQPQHGLIRLALGMSGLMIFAPALDVRPHFNALSGINTLVMLSFTLSGYLWLHALFTPRAGRKYRQLQADFFATLHWQAAQALGAHYQARWHALAGVWRDQSTLAQAAALQDWLTSNAAPNTEPTTLQQWGDAFYVLSASLGNVRNNAQAVVAVCAAEPILQRVSEDLLQVMALLAQGRTAELDKAAALLQHCQAALDQWWLTTGEGDQSASVGSAMLHLLHEALQRYVTLHTTRPPRLAGDED